MDDETTTRPAAPDEVDGVRCDRCGVAGVAWHRCAPRVRSEDRAYCTACQRHVPLAHACVADPSRAPATYSTDASPRRAYKPPQKTNSRLLNLLRDCVRIAWVDALSAPRSVALGGAGGAAGAPATDPPDWVLDRVDALRDARRLRAKLDALAAQGRAEQLVQEAARQAALQAVADAKWRPPALEPTAELMRAIDLLKGQDWWLLRQNWEVRVDELERRRRRNAERMVWAELAFLIEAYHDLAAIPRSTPPAAARAAAVISWLVPRAKALLESAGSQGVPVDKGLARLVAQAFVASEQWERWHPKPPAPPVPPERQAPPEDPGPYVARPAPAPPTPLPEDAAPWDREHHARLVAQHRRDLREHAAGELAREARHAALVRDHQAALEAHARRHKRYEDEVRRHQATVARHRLAAEAGRVGADRHGTALLRLAELVWLGPPKPDEDDRA